MTADATNPRFGSVARLSFGMPKNAVKPTLAPENLAPLWGRGNPLPMVADWKIVSKNGVYETVSCLAKCNISSQETIHKRMNTVFQLLSNSIASDLLNNRMIIFTWIMIFPSERTPFLTFFLTLHSVNCLLR